MKRLTITSLDADGNVVKDVVTNTKWYLTELDYYLHLMKQEILADKIENIIIGVKKDG